MSSPNLPQYSAAGLDFPLAYTTMGSGPTLLLIHGSLCDYRYWRWQVEKLSPQLEVLAPSLRGYWPHAFDRPHGDFSIARHADDLIAWLRLYKPGRPVHVLGHSRGAHVALEVAIRAPEHVRSLTLADPGFRVDTHGWPEGSHSFQLQAAERLAKGDVDGAMSLFIDIVSGPDTWQKMVGWFKTMVRDNAYTLLSQVNELDLKFDLSRARQVNCPVLLLGGAQSPARYGYVQDLLEPKLRNVERDTIALAAHGMNLANPRAFNARVLQFLTSV